MFPFLKSRRKKHEIQIIDLTINSTLEDDYILPTRLIHELSIRGIRANCTPIVAEQRIADWEQNFSIKSIRNEYNDGEFYEVIDLVNARAKVYTEIEPLIHKLRSEYKLQLWADSIETCNEILKIEKDNHIAIRFIARCAVNMEDYDKAKMMYEKLLESDFEDTDSIMALIRIHYNEKSFEDVIKYSNKLINIEEDSIIGHRFLYRAHINLDNLESAVLHLNAILKSEENDVEALVELGRTKYKMKEYAQAKDVLEKVLIIEKGERRACRTLALIYDREGDWDSASKLYEEECETDPYLFSNWEKHISLLYKLNRVEEAKQCIDQILSIDGDRIELSVLAHSLCRSYFWEDLANEIRNDMEKRWRREHRLYILLAKKSLDAGNLTDCYHSLSKIKRKDRKISGYHQVLDDLKNILDKVNCNFKYLKKALKRNENVLQTECAIRHILSLSKDVPKYKPRSTNQRLVMVSSTLGRGGAERQVLTCLNQLDKSKRFASINLLCRFQGSEEVEATYYEEINRLNVEIDQYQNESDWDSKFGISEIPDKFKQPLSLLPDTMQLSISKYYAAIDKIKPDIVHGWQDLTNVEIALTCAMQGVPGVVMFARSLRPDGKTMAHIRKRKYFKEAYKEILKDNKIQFSHNSDAGKLSYSSWLKIPQKRFSVIHNGIDFTEFEVSSDDGKVQEIIDSFSIPDDAVIIGCVFRMVREKRPNLWIDALHKCIQSNDRIHGIMVGGGPLMPEISAKISELGLEKRIHLVGQTNNVKPWLDKYDLFLLTSSVEGLPNVLIEAQAFGVPVISTEAGGARDTFINGTTGHIVSDNSNDISERIISTLDDSEWMEIAQSKSISHARQKFSPETMAENLSVIYEQSLSSYKR